MKVNQISSNYINVGFGCDKPECQNCNNVQTACCTQPQQDTVELSTGQKVKKACKKGAKFVKENKKGIAVTAKAALEGLLTACTILGANQLMQKVSKADTSSLASKLAIIGGLAVAGTQLIKDRKAFKKEVAK